MKSGDWLSTIARDMGVDEDSIRDESGGKIPGKKIPDKNKIRPGRILLIPSKK